MLGLPSDLNLNIIQIFLNCLTFNEEDGYSKQPCIHYDGREFAARYYLSFHFQVSIALLSLVHQLQFNVIFCCFKSSGNHLNAKSKVIFRFFLFKKPLSALCSKYCGHYYPFYVHPVLDVKQFLMNRIREITARVAAAVLKEAVKEDLAAGYRQVDLEELQQIIQDEVSY
jgi:hypothetical protein